MQELLDYAASSQDEVCALVIDGDRVYRCRNVHPQPEKQFRIADEDWLAAENEGEVMAVFHSHPMDYPVLSGADRRAQVVSCLPWWLACGGQILKFRPVPFLLGRKYEHGVMDCYTLFRDAYHLCGVDLPNFERANGWWLRGVNLYLKNMPINGFYQISPDKAQPGDIIIRQPFTGADPCHAMILLDDNMVLHHDHAGHLSRREPMRPAYVKQMHSIWRHEQCSSLNLQGIYADISAKSS